MNIASPEVVKTFQIRILDFQPTANPHWKIDSLQLEIAFKLVPLTFNQQLKPYEVSQSHVVNSFQISIFDFQATAHRKMQPLSLTL